MALVLFGRGVIMRKLSEKELTIRAIECSTELAIPSSEIIINQSATGDVISGAVLEAAVSWNDFYLLFLTDDIPQEDTLSIHFLDKELKLLDSATIGAMYSTGSFTSLQLIKPNTLTFRFIGDTDWKIKLFDKPTLTLPFLSDPKCVKRKLALSNYFKVQGSPIPESAK